jgi:hypothetical protein
MSPIAGLTNVPKAFLRLGHIRKGEKDERGFPKVLDYFRVTFNNQPECEDAFKAAYGEKPTSINIRLAFPDVAEVWDANFEAYSKGGLIAKAASTETKGLYWIFFRNHADGTVLVRNGLPVGEEGLELTSKPIDPEAPIYSYKNKNGGDVPVMMEPVGRLNVVVPEISGIRVGYLEFRAGSTKDIMAISRELAAIDYFARQAGKDITGLPLKLTRQPEDITKNIGGKLSRGESWMVHIEVGGEWGGRALEVIDRLALPASTSGEAIEAEVRDVVEDGVPEHNVPWETMVEAEQFEKIFPVEEKKPAPKPENAVSGRPYEPATFKVKYEAMVKQMEKKGEVVLGEKDAQVLASTLDAIYAGDKLKRHEFTYWLVGKASTKDMSPAQVKCLLKIMDVSGFDQPPSVISMKEIRMAHSEALRAMGQTELPLEGGA